MKVLIVTPNFSEFNPGYSLTSIVTDQIKMLHRNGHDVDVLVAERYTGGDIEGANILKEIPKVDLVDYKTLLDIGSEHLRWAEGFSDAFEKLIHAHDVVFTHDIVFTGWNLPIYIALKSTGVKDRGFLHWVHSIPNHGYDWWNLKDLGKNHRIVSPNRSYRQLVAEAFKGQWEDVVPIPHIRDVRVVNYFGEDTWEFIDRHPGALNADIVQVYPASCDRLDFKGMRELVLIFKELKSLGFSVCLICANQWATGRQPKISITEYEELALRNGLTKREFIFTSGDKPEYESGIPHKMLMELFHLSNLFIFPTKSESFGLVLPEALLTGCVLPVINSHLSVLDEVLEGRGLQFGFGSFQHALNHPVGGEANYLKNVAAVIAARMQNEEGVVSRSICRQQYNMDSIYRKYYLPVMEDMKQWMT